MITTSNFPIVVIGPEGEPVASTEAIALGYKSTHEAVIKLVRRYKSQLEAFGLVRFQIRARQKGKHGGGNVEFALLNERQAGFLVSLMRNTPEVVDFKLNMAMEFWRLADALHNRDLTMWERRLRFEIKDQKSRTKGTIGSHLLHGRRKEKPGLESERHLIESEMQPALFVGPPNTHHKEAHA